MHARELDRLAVVTVFEIALLFVGQMVAFHDGDESVDRRETIWPHRHPSQKAYERHLD